MTATTTTQRLESALSAVDYPVEYGGLSGVVASVRRTDDGGPAEHGDRANARRRHTQPGLAEREKDVPSNPIADELGKNRGSWNRLAAPDP